MRHITFALTVLLATANPSAAQGHPLGVKGGVSIATQQTEINGERTSFDSRVGAVAGAFWTLPLGSRLDLQVEGLYTMKGARLSFRGIESTFALDYIEVPVLVRARFGSGRTRYYAAGGPSTAFRVRARMRTPFNGSVEERDVADQVEEVDFGIAAGGGVEIGRLVVDGRYTFGLTDVDTDTTSKTRNRAIAVTAGFRF
jgi:hypothetical protein